MYIHSQPALYVVDEGTRFQAVRRLPKMSSAAVWNALEMCWIDCYLGPTDIINHDAGTNFPSNEFQIYAKWTGIKTREAPIRNANTMGIVQRYHLPLRRAYEILKSERKSANKTFILQAAVKAVNDTSDLME